ncbi:ATPase complex subunit 9 [Lathyrus oleraceus]|uniref:ATP synthase subunit 9, mitochondrial n=1 Tax=Pisum sativum TaxID=3888 RepID=A0A9D4XKH0_PEA|nr:ATPase complex subunit 9 [Pisum sativum]
MLEGAKSIGVGAATIASARGAVDIGNVFSLLIHSVARNPSLEKHLIGYAILGFALTEGVVPEDESPSNGGEKSGYAGFFHFRFGERIVEQQKA